MYWIILFSTLCVVLTYLEDRGIIKHGMRLGFFIMILFLSIRYEYGNDFSSYRDIFLNVKMYKWNELNELTQWIEIGWLVLCKLFQPIGFQGLITFHTIFIFTSVYYLINKHVPTKYKTLAVFFFLFNSNILVIYLSMLRQSMAICCFILAMDVALDKKIGKMIVLTLLAFLLHRSAIIIIPFILLSYSSSSWIIKTTGIILCGLLLIMIINPSVAGNIFFYALSSIDTLGNEYENYLEAGSKGSGLGLIAESIVFLPFLFNYKKFSNTEKVIVLIFFINIVSFPMQYIVAMFSRIRFYFVSLGIIAIPLLFKRTSRFDYKIIIGAVLVLITLWNYYSFFNSDVFYRYYYTYNTIFNLI